MDDGDEKKWIKKLCNKRTFSFTYNNIVDINPNPSNDIELFWPRQNIAAKFSIYTIHFKSTAKLNDTFNYNFRL